MDCKSIGSAFAGSNPAPATSVPRSFRGVISPRETEPTGGSTIRPPTPRARSSRADRFRRFAAKVDTQPALLTAAERLRRQLPGDERFGDVLSTAGTHPVEVVGRGVSVVAARATEPGAGARPGRTAGLAVAVGEGRSRTRQRELAILFTDLVGFSSWALKAGDVATLELLRDVGVSVEGAVTAHDGRVVKRLGDGVMATFLAPRPRWRRPWRPRRRWQSSTVRAGSRALRAGVHWGSPRKLGGDYLGVDVNIAARVSAAAKANQVLVSDVLLSRMELGDLRAGRAKRLRADGTPRDLHVVQITRG